MSAAKLNLVIEQGATFAKTLTYQDSAGDAIDLTSYVGRMQIREKVTDAATVVDLTEGNGGIVMGGVAGTIDLLITAAATAAFTWTKGVYDVEIELSGVVTRLVEGGVTVNPEVTR